MNLRTIAVVLGIGMAASLAGPPPKTKPLPKDPPPPVVRAPAADAPAAQAPAQSPSTEAFIYDQKPLTGRPVLVSPEQARGVMDKFKASYAKMGSPRLLIYVNRELVDEQSGLKLAGRTEKTSKSQTEIKSDFKADPAAPPAASNNPSTPPASNVTIVGDVRGGADRIPGKKDVAAKSEKSTAENQYRVQERPTQSLADKQTVRDVERLFGRPLRMAGASLVDQRVAAQLIEGRDLSASQLAGEGEQAKKDREAVGKIADVVLEVLISSRNITVGEIGSDKVYVVPDIQATAVRLKDSKILGQATASDIIGKDRYAGNIARNFDVREIAEATALALMEDMLTGQE